MVMQAPPIFDAYLSIAKNLNYKPHTIYLSPKGSVLTQKKCVELSKKEHIVLLCGHYEGVDQRVLDKIVDEEISIGDYVLTGGELPAMVLVDSVARMIPEVLSSSHSAMDESIYSGLLEYDQYTKPREYKGMQVPDVLVSGNHKLILLWKFEESLKITKERRPDLFEAFLKREHELTKDEKKILHKIVETD